MQVPAVSRYCVASDAKERHPVSYTIAFRQRLHNDAQFTRDLKN